VKDLVTYLARSVLSNVTTTVRRAEKLKITRLNTILKQACSDDGRLG